MLNRALNHMAAPRLTWSEFLDLAKDLGCVGVEFRNDLEGELFDGARPETVAEAARSRGLRILALAEVKAFDDWSDAKLEEASDLISIAHACGAEKISLIARNDGKGMGETERRANLDLALRELMPLLQQHDLVGLIEPLGFETCALRDKRDAIEAIERVGGRDRFCIVHDTFHHAAAGGGRMFAEYTGIVHVSGVVAPNLKNTDLRDDLRVLVDENDQIGNVEQLSALLDAGYDGPVSFEPFSPEVLRLSNPKDALSKSFAYISKALEAGIPT